MENKYANILSYYEKVVTVAGNIDGDRPRIQFAAPSSLHSSITKFAYGTVTLQTCVDISDGKGIKIAFSVDKKALQGKYLLQITASLAKWELNLNDITLFWNGKEFYSNPRMFFENVYLGWPTKYVEIPQELVTEDENELIILTKNSTGAGLYLQSVNLLSTPSFVKNTQITCRRYARIGEEYSIAVFCREEEISVENLENCELLKIAPMYGVAGASVLTLRSFSLGQANAICVLGGEKSSLLLPQIVAKSYDKCFVGFDSEDHTHDDMEETDRILRHLVGTAIGDFVQIRPNRLRNYIDESSRERWEERVKLLAQFQTTVSMCDHENVLKFIPEIIPDYYFGRHIHEPYLYFCKKLRLRPEVAEEYHIDVARLEGATTFGESKRLYLEALRIMKEENATGSAYSVGTPCLLCAYEALEFERMTMEPVSGVNLLCGAIRAAAQKGWGAHIPLAWYFGAPNDETKSRKFLCALLYLYLNGADYLYTENGVFKTHAFSREEWNGKFCTDNRKNLQNFYDYTVLHPREGKLTTDLAIVFGNNDYLLWREDERIAEMGENEDWDITYWGKWKDIGQQKFWRAASAWLPFASNQNSREDNLNLHLFSGTPYGSVDVAPYSADYHKYRAITFLGWNTYEDGLCEKLYQYANEGGIVYISYRHFNRTDTTDLPPDYEESDLLSALLGVKVCGTENIGGKLRFIDGKKIIADKKLPAANCQATTATPIVQDEKGNTLVYCNRVGKGKVYFSALAYYDSPDWAIELDKEMLRIIGREVADVICDNPNVSFVERVQADGSRKVCLLSMNTNSVSKEKFSLSYSVKVGGERTERVVGEVNSEEIVEFMLPALS